MKYSCQTIFLLVAAAVMVFIALLVAAWTYVGWWAAVLVFFAGVVVAAAVVKRLVVKLMMLPFTAKSRVLRGAGVEVHKVEKVGRPRARRERGVVDQAGNSVRAETVETAPGALPAGQEVFDPRGAKEEVKEAAEPVREPIVEEAGAAEAGPPRDYWRIDVTITPAGGNEKPWEPASMVLVPFAAKSNYSNIKNEDAVFPVDMEIFSPGGVPVDLRAAHAGVLRVRYTFALPLASEVKRWKLRYYFEGLGEVRVG